MIPSGPKSTWEDQAREIVKQGYPAVAPILGDLVEWLADINWPGAWTIAEFLRSIGEPTIPYVKRIFQGSDRMWQYWVLCELVAHWDPDLVSQVEPELLALTALDHDEEGIGPQAKRILAKLWSSTLWMEALPKAYEFPINSSERDDGEERRERVIEKGHRVRKPDRPGVYIFHAGDRCLYVGKASQTTLVGRALDYLYQPGDRDLVYRTIRCYADRLTITKVDNDPEARRLELELIVKLRPVLNEGQIYATPKDIADFGLEA